MKRRREGKIEWALSNDVRKPVRTLFGQMVKLRTGKFHFGIAFTVKRNQFPTVLSKIV